MNWYDAIEAQAEFHKFAASEAGFAINTYFFDSFMDQLDFNYTKIHKERPTFRRDLPVAQAGHVRDSLWQADPIFVNTDMCEIVAAGANDLDHPFWIPPSDLLCKKGFAIFEKPIMQKAWASHIGLEARQEYPIGGFLWDWAPNYLANMRTDGEMEEGLTTLYLLVDSHHEADNEGKDLRERLHAGYGVILPRYHLIHYVFLHKNMGWDKDWPEESGMHIAKFFSAFQMIAQQPIASSTRERPPRATAKRMRKWREGDSYVTLITLRRKRGKREDEPERGEWDHRWIVRGHWRNQWYPTLQKHMPCYIHEHVKGPEDKPLVISKRVFRVIR